MTRRLTMLRILWPSFLMAGVTGAIVFALVDPLDMTFLGYLHADRPVVYAAGFFLFWGMAALSSALTLRLNVPDSDADEIDGLP